MVRHTPGSCVHTSDRFFAGSLAVIPTPVFSVAAAENSLDTVWFIKINDEMRTDLESVKDKYGNTGLADQPYISGHFLESTRYPNFYAESRKAIYFVHPCVQVEYTKQGHLERIPYYYQLC